MAILNDASVQSSDTALVLTGGGARAAYQAGVLKSIAKIVAPRNLTGQRDITPFSILVGTSAGAINAAAIAARADNFSAAVEHLEATWSNFRSASVFRSDPVGIAASGAKWLGTLALGWAVPARRPRGPQSLLDVAPLRATLADAIPIHRIRDHIDSGAINGVAVTALSYSNGIHHTFYDSRQDIAPWTRSQRAALRCRLDLEHLLASAAIPFAFPPVELTIAGRREWCGDGSMRQMAPISPAIHLGANRVVVIGTGRNWNAPPEPIAVANGSPPSLALIGGQALSSIFLDALASDLEQIYRLNELTAKFTSAQRQSAGLRPIEVLSFFPSEPLELIAARHLLSLPISIRLMLRAIGVGGRGLGARGALLASYLLFERDYTRALIQLGEIDAMNRRLEIEGFFSPARRAGCSPLPGRGSPAPRLG